MAKKKFKTVYFVYFLIFFNIYKLLYLLDDNKEYEDEIADEDIVPLGRTRICKDGEFPGKRIPSNFIVQFNGTDHNERENRDPHPEDSNVCWFIPDASIKSDEDCKHKFAETQTCEKSHVFVPLGVTTVCIMFEASPEWFLSEGTNGYCGVSDCCEWYPRETKMVVYCSPKWPLLNWYPKEAGNDCSKSIDKARIGVQIIKGKAGEIKNVCLAHAKPENESIVTLKTAPAKLTNKCGGGCCIFDLMTKDN